MPQLNIVICIAGLGVRLGLEKIHSRAFKIMPNFGKNLDH